MDISERINRYLVAAEQAKTNLEKIHNRHITDFEIQLALARHLVPDAEGIEIRDASLKILEADLSASEIVEILKDYQFEEESEPSEIVGRVVLDESILPSGIVGIVLENQFTIKGQIWVVHKNDKDS